MAGNNSENKRGLRGHPTLNTMRVRNDLFDPKRNFSRGRPFLVFALWQVTKWMFFRTVFPWPSRVKLFWLRVFGAKVGLGAYMKPQVNVHFPWKLEIGDFAWIGEEVFILNFEPIRIGSHACISQRAFLCAGNHDFRDPGMSYRNRPVVVEDGAWVGAQVFVGPGVTVGAEAVISAGSVLLKDAEAGLVYSGNPAKPTGPRWR
jgi:putative colanic acid biosynthesis acetyltransferase WcaF